MKNRLTVSVHKFKASVYFHKTQADSVRDANMPPPHAVVNVLAF